MRLLCPKDTKKLYVGGLFQSRCFIMVVPRLLETFLSFYLSLMTYCQKHTRVLFCLCLCPPMTPPSAQEMQTNLVWFLHRGMWLEIKVGSNGLCRICSEAGRTRVRFVFILLSCSSATKQSDYFLAAWRTLLGPVPHYLYSACFMVTC